jgi:hypothetical protein
LPPWCSARLVRLKVARISEFPPLTMLALIFQINFTTSCGTLKRALIVPKQELTPAKEALPPSA